eukprot:gb/GECG01008162.1/.p1 GENE.gb/GECG01008162.1/~~gb/GECG01008162.1/.p1  ORF type:complete len:180 (+),score=17.44 gb/GECG01008162.1/:1-540(+)
MNADSKDPEHVLAPFNPSSDEAIAQCIRLLDIHPEDVVYDIGCGDGRSLVEACVHGQCRKGIGIEWDEELCRRARNRIQDKIDQGVINPAIQQIDVQCADALNYTYDDGTVFILYLTPSGLRKIEHVLREKYGQGARIATNFFQIPGWKATQSILTSRMRVHLYYKAQSELNGTVAEAQ